MDDRPFSTAKHTDDAVFLVIPAGGRGLRMGGETPKQFRDWGGRPLLRATLEAFLKPGMPRLAAVALSVPPDRLTEVQSWDLGVPLRVVEGGATRQASVAAALAALPEDSERPVLIHDAVRPFPPAEAVWEAVRALESWDGALLVEPSTDTLKRVDACGRVITTEPRELIVRAQTPQVARLGAWQRAFASALASGFEGTDDVSLLEALELRVKVILSTSANLKLTTPEDWLRHCP